MGGGGGGGLLSEIGGIEREREREFVRFGREGGWHLSGMFFSPFTVFSIVFPTTTTKGSFFLLKLKDFLPFVFVLIGESEKVGCRSVKYSEGPSNRNEDQEFGLQFFGENIVRGHMFSRLG